MNDRLAGTGAGAGAGAQGGARGSPPRPGAARALSARRGTPGATLASGAPHPAPAEASGAPGRAAERHCDSWVREKVLFLMHPERWLGARGDAPWEEVAGGEAPAETRRADPEPEQGCAAARFPPEQRLLPARGGAPAAAPRPVLVRVEDHQVTREVLCTAWRKGRMTTKTEERLVTAVTFRTGGQ
nr:uncharacterized protein C6orf141 homolog [Cavia porcellus]